MLNTTSTVPNTCGVFKGWMVERTNQDGGLFIRASHRPGAVGTMLNWSPSAMIADWRLLVYPTVLTPWCSWDIPLIPRWFSCSSGDVGIPRSHLRTHDVLTEQFLRWRPSRRYPAGLMHWWSQCRGGQWMLVPPKMRPGLDPNHSLPIQAPSPHNFI